MELFKEIIRHSSWSKNVSLMIWYVHRRTSLRGLQTIIFRAQAKFFGQKPAAKNEKKYTYFCIYYTKKRNLFRLAR